MGCRGHFGPHAEISGWNTEGLIHGGAYFRNSVPFLGPGACFSKGPLTYRARRQVLKSKPVEQ